MHKYQWYTFHEFIQNVSDCNQCYSQIVHSSIDQWPEFTTNTHFPHGSQQKYKISSSHIKTQRFIMFNVNAEIFSFKQYSNTSLKNKWITLNPMMSTIRAKFTKFTYLPYKYSFIMSHSACICFTIQFVTRARF